MHVMPYKPWMPPPSLAARVSCPPYDVVSEDAGRALLAAAPECFLRITRPECALPPEPRPPRETLYARAAADLDTFRARGWLCREQAPALYVYRLAGGDHRQTGLVGLFDVEDYAQGRIHRHEHTRIETEKERADHMRALGAQTGLVFLAHRPWPPLEAALAEEARGTPLLDFEASDGVRHTVWRATRSDALADRCAELPAAYIADGHHRAAAAAREAARMGGGIQAALFPAASLRILPYHRLLHGWSGLDATRFLDAARKEFTVTPAAEGQPDGPGHIRLYTQGHWYDLHHRVHEQARPPDSLDVAVLQARLLGPVLGITDPRKDPLLSFAGGSTAPEALQRCVDKGEAVAAFALFAVRMEDVMDVADEGRVMPPKSTWFEPKLRSGLFLHTGV